MKNMEKIAQILIHSEKNEIGGIPIFLNVDNEDVTVDLKKMPNFIIVGKNSEKSIERIVEQINEQCAIVWLKNTDDLLRVFKDVKSRVKNNDIYVPPQIIVITDISVFDDQISILKELLTKGAMLSSYFLCACKTNSVADKYNLTIPVKMYDEYMEQAGENMENLFTFVGTIRKINC